MILRNISIFLFLVGMQLTLHAQTSIIDSLENLLKQHDSEDTLKINLLNEIANLSRSIEKEKTLKYATEAVKLAEKINFAKGKAESLKLIGLYYYSKYNYTNALNFLQKSLRLNETINEKKEIAICLNSIGVIYRSQFNYPRSLENYQKALKIYEQINDKKGIAKSLMNMGIVYKDQLNYSQALDFYQKALKIYEQMNDKIEIVGCLNHIGNAHNYPKSLEYYKKALKINEELNLKKGTAITLNNIGRTLTLENDFLQALEYLQKAQLILEELRDRYFLCEIYRNIGILYLRQKNYTAALPYFNKSLALAEELKILKHISDAHFYLSEIYDATNNYQKAFESYKIYKKFYDSIFNKENNKKIAGLEFQYRYEKEKELDKAEQDKKDALYEAEKKQQRIVIYSFLVGFVLLILVIALVVRSNIQKRKTNIILTNQKEEIQQKNIILEQQKEEINTQNEELHETLEIVSLQKEEIFQTLEVVSQQKEEITSQCDLLHRQKKDIMDSINYASKIQKAVLPSEEEFSEVLPEHFVLFKPRNVVSGDFYWLKKVKNFTFIAIADCTGHGVPGAFMSMLGMSLLNEVVSGFYIDKTGFILDKLRKRIKHTLKQNDPNSIQKDGMDIVLISIDMESLQMQYSGAYNPLYVVRKKLYNFENQLDFNMTKFEILQSETATLIEFKGDRQPVAVHLKETDFETLHFQLQKGDVLYAGSDGYADQIGGENQKKFMSRNLKKLLLDINDKQLSEHSEILNSKMEQWKQGHEQMDDILLVGMMV